MKLRRLIQLTASVATAAVLSACGGGGETGPQWAQDTKSALAKPTPYNIKSYASACEPLDIDHSFSFVLVTYQTSEGDFEQVQNNYYDGLVCGDANVAMVVKLPTSKVTANGTFVDPDLGLTTTRQTKITAGGEVIIVKVNPLITVERFTDQLGDYYGFFLPPQPGSSAGGFQSTVPTPVVAGTQLDVAAFDDGGNTLYWGDTSASAPLDNDGFPTQLSPQTFTLVPNIPANAPALP